MFDQVTTVDEKTRFETFSLSMTIWDASTAQIPGGRELCSTTHRAADQSTCVKAVYRKKEKKTVKRTHPVHTCIGKGLPSTQKNEKLKQKLSLKSCYRKPAARMNE